ncbi:MAG: hypothetical protein M1813_003775 [Trichoglossum hirsutum]|nr:MAG: hypothetical protein M1813_003775 [Trichoglossum hirsutum]
MNYTPRCLWCLGIFNLLPAAVDLMHDAFDLCVSEPLNFKPCPSDCGGLQQHVDTTITPCVKQAMAAGVKDPEKECWCTTTTQTLVTNCWFCMLGWNQTMSAAIKAKLDVCGGVFRADPRATSSVVAIARPTNASFTVAALAQATMAPSVVTPLELPTGKIKNGTMAERRRLPSAYLPTPAAATRPRGGPAEGYFQIQNTAIAVIKSSGSRRPPVMWWWSCSMSLMIILLYSAGVF